MAIRYEYFDGDDSAVVHSYGAGRDAQTFKPSISHIITKVVLRLYRGVGQTGVWVVEILATGGDGKPTGDALTSGTIDIETFAEATPVWVEITLTPYSLLADTTYAIALSAPDGAPGNQTTWYGDSWGGYANGAYYYTLSPGGGEWIGPYSTVDLKFEEWGTLVHVFHHWDINGSIVTDNPYDLTMNSEKVVTPYFEHGVTGRIRSSPVGGDSDVGSGIYKGGIVTLTAIPK